ncbi:MAG: radical SAM/Cys-rich domain protein [Verrucomicrobia bacterium]|nr:radical SAM/Cys-rich domain protein [Verrucomicrobiota bacterium]
MNLFDEKLAEHSIRLDRGRLETLQINVGRKCNQACRHCHVDAAPWRTEMMDATTADKIIEWIKEHRPKNVDITGGAPEISEHFRRLVTESRSAGSHVMDRNNLTILEEPGYEDLHHFLADHEVEVIASLPCYTSDNVSKQRGQGVFEKSIRGLQKLNNLGYGSEKLTLNLVYNPLGANLPGPQAELEQDYKEILKKEFGIIFNQLFCITNQPLARFAEDLRKSDQLNAYMDLLVDSFNPETKDSLMCRSTLSVGYMGEVYDCDFNQMLNMQMRNGKLLFLWDVNPDRWKKIQITTGNHCLACTAGAGSSCTGTLS